MSLSKQETENKALTNELKRFTNKFVQMHREDAKKSVKLVTEFVKELVLHVRDSFYDCYEAPRGSYYERLRVINANEFDFDICLHAFERKCSAVQPPSGSVRTPDYKLVRLDNEDRIANVASITRTAAELGLSGGGKYLDAPKLYSMFHSHVQRVLNKRDFQSTMLSQFPGFQAKIRQNKPALTLLLKANGYQEIDLDLCIAIVFRGTDPFDVVPKEYPAPSPYRSVLWRQQYTEQEGRKLRALDADGTCRKQCVRILKVLRELAPIPSPLKSHHIKILLFHELEKYPSSAQWEMEKLGERILGLLTSLEEALARRYLHYYFFSVRNPCNLFEYYPHVALQNCADRVRRIKNKLRVNPTCLQNPQAI